MGRVRVMMTGGHFLEWNAERLPNMPKNQDMWWKVEGQQPTIIKLEHVLTIQYDPDAPTVIKKD